MSGNRKGMRVKEYDYSENGAYFITICTQDKKCVLSQIVGTGGDACPCIKLLPYGKVAEKFLKQLNDFYDNVSIDSYVIMPNHIHFILILKGQSGTPTGQSGTPTGQSGTPTGQSGTPTGQSRTPVGQSGTPVPTGNCGVNPNVNSTVAKFVSTFKRFCNKEYGNNIWQPRYYDHIIRNIADYQEHLTYIADNPIKWQLDKLYIK